MLSLCIDILVRKWYNGEWGRMGLIHEQIAMKTPEGVEVKLLTFLTSSLDGGEWSSCFGHLYSIGKSLQCPVSRKMGKILAPTRNLTMGTWPGIGLYCTDTEYWWFRGINVIVNVRFEIFMASYPYPRRLQVIFIIANALWLQDLSAGLKSAPVDGLIWRLAVVMSHVVHALGDVRAAAHLWYEFTQEMRYRWENGITIPG